MEHQRFIEEHSQELKTYLHPNAPFRGVVQKPPISILGLAAWSYNTSQKADQVVQQAGIATSKMESVLKELQGENDKVSESERSGGSAQETGEKVEVSGSERSGGSTEDAEDE